MGLFVCLLLGMCSGWITKSLHPKLKGLSYKTVLLIGSLGGFAGCTIMKWGGVDAVGKVNLISLLLSILIGAICTFVWIVRSHDALSLEED